MLKVFIYNASTKTRLFQLEKDHEEEIMFIGRPGDLFVTDNRIFEIKKIEYNGVTKIMNLHVEEQTPWIFTKKE